MFDLDHLQRTLKELEEVEDIRAYDAARASGDGAIPFEQAVYEIRRNVSR